MKANADRLIVHAVRTIAAESGWSFASHGGDWVLRVRSDIGELVVAGYTFGCNPSSGVELARDKAACAWVLESEGIDVVPHHLVPGPAIASWTGEPSFAVSARAALVAFGWPVVVKPNDGTGGNRVQLVANQIELEHALVRVFAAHRAAAVCPHREIRTETRVVVFDGSPMLVYDKEPGDGDGLVRHNLGRGGTAHVRAVGEATTEVALAVAAVEALRLRFASVDVIESDVDGDGVHEVLEVNAGVMLESFAAQSDDNVRIATAIYRTVVEEVLS